MSASRKCRRHQEMPGDTRGVEDTEDIRRRRRYQEMQETQETPGDKTSGDTRRHQENRRCRRQQETPGDAGAAVVVDFYAKPVGSMSRVTLNWWGAFFPKIHGFPFWEGVRRLPPVSGHRPSPFFPGFVRKGDFSFGFDHVSIADGFPRSV